VTHPYLPLYVDDFEAATAHLTIEEDGVYSRLLRLCWRTPGCSIPNDPAWIARKIRLSADDFERVARPVIDEFFRVQRGRLVQKRLKEEYDNISRKKSARKKAGSAGGSQKALNAKGNTSSNATILPAHTRAFPEPEPEPEPKEPPVVPPRGTKSPKVTKAQVDAVWSQCPVIARHRSSVADVESALNAALRRGHAPEAVLAGLLAAYRSDTYAGDKAKGVHRLIEKDRWASFTETASAPATGPAPTFNAPAVRASIVQATDEDFARSYVDHYCRWVPTGRRLEASKPAVVAILTGRLSAWAKAKDVTIALMSANDAKPDLFTEGDAA